MDNTDTRLAILGGGNMGEALLSGLLTSGFALPGELTVAEIHAPRRDDLAARFGVKVVDDVADAARNARAIVLAVKPQEAPAVLDRAATVIARDALLISICAGIPIGVLEASIGESVAVVRTMPNTPALIGEGVAAIAAGTHATAEHIELAKQVLGAVGEVVVVSEKHLDVVTALSGNGPAYVFLLAEAMTDAAVAAGLPRDVAATLTRRTISGAGRMLVETDLSPTELRTMVTSPGGTTAAAMRVLEASGFRSTFYEAIAAGAERAHQLGLDAGR